MKSENAKKIESLINQIEEIPSLDRKLFHDLQAQLINIRGFTIEISKSVDDIQTAMTEFDLPPEFVEKLSGIAANDLVPCLTFLEQSSTNLSEKLSEIFEDAD